MYRVKEHSDLAKNPTTGSVININRTAFEQYKKAKNARKNDKKKIANLEERLARMESIVESLIDGRS